MRWFRRGSAGVPDEGTDLGASAAIERRASIYAAVVRQLVTKDHTFGRTDPGFRMVYVLDGSVAGVADPSRRVTKQAPADRFPARLKEILRLQLADLPPLEFVARRSDVVVGEEAGTSPGQVVDGGVLVTLGPIRTRRNRVTVACSLWINGLAGSWQTYVLARRGGRWIVRGTTGPMAIS